MINDNLNKIKSSLSEGVELCAISKYHPEEELLEAYNAGQRIFGESHVQELVRKEAALPKDIEWHFIGHLQTNKVKYIAPFISLIHSVDTEKLLAEINKQALKCGRKIPVLLQIHAAMEETKYGFSIEECRNLFTKGSLSAMQGVDIKGVMTMATNCDDPEQWRKEFRSVKQFLNEVSSYFNEPPICSMGMSHDYKVAMEEGSTMVRIGTAIFGERVY